MIYHYLSLLPFIYHISSTSPFHPPRPCHGPKALATAVRGASTDRVQRAAVLRGRAQRQLGPQLVAGQTLGRGEHRADAWP